MRNTLSGARTELFEQLDGLLDGINTYDHELAPGGAQGPLALTVSTVGVNPDFFIFAVRLYCDIGTDPRSFQVTLDESILLIEDAVSSHYGPSDWTVSPHPDRPDVLVAEWVVQCGRED